MQKRIMLLVVVVFLCLGLFSCGKKEPTDGDQEEEVKGYGAGEIVISVFWPPMKGFTTEEQFDYLVEAGIDLLEWGTDPIFTDEETIRETLRLCNEKGLKITIADKDWIGIEKKSDKEIRELVRRYKDNECVVGYLLLDEPHNANPFGRVAKIMAEEHPGCIAQLNMLPMGALPDPRGHAEDWISSAGRENVRYLSYDQYPFALQPGSIPQMFGNMNFVREVGLKYNVDTALYIQSVGVIDKFRRTNVNEIRYHTSAALAYGYKNLKYFTWITPVERSEQFTLAIISPEGEKTDLYDGVAQINRDIKKVSSILGKLDAVEIYHNGRQDASTKMLEPGWYVEATDKKDFLVSLMVDRNTKRNYLMVVNKNFNKDTTLALKLNGIDSLMDVTSGEEEEVAITDGTIQCELLAGGFRLYRLAEGVSLHKEYQDADANLALDKPVYSNYSRGNDGYFNYKAVDGNRVSTERSRGWRYEGKGDEEIYIMVDLKRAVDINRVDLYPVSIGDEERIGQYFPRKFTILYSTNGKDYKKILSDTWESGKELSYSFDTVKARYVKIRIDEAVKVSDIYIAEICEIEIYNDDGTLPKYQRVWEKDKTLIPEYNVALNKRVKTSSSLEAPQWGWMRKHINDGMIKATNTHSGWTTQTGRHMTDPYAEEWVLIDLGEKFNIDTVVLYPRQDTGYYFPKHLVVEVSLDEKDWTEVYELKESGAVSTIARVLKFDAVDSRYVRVVSKEMTQVESSPDGYLFQLAEFEVYRTGRQ